MNKLNNKIIELNYLYKEENIMNNEYNDIDIFDEEFFELEEGFLSKRRDKKIDKKIGKKEA